MRSRNRQRHRGGWRPVNYSPASEGPMFAWFETDSGLTLASGAGTWVDQSGTGNLIQNTDALQPTKNTADAAYNGKDSLSLNGSQYMKTAAYGAAIAQPFTWIVVGNDDGVAVNQYYLEGDLTGTNRSILGASIITAAYSTYSGTEAGGGVRSNAKRILCGVNSNTNSYFYNTAKTPVVGPVAAGTNGVSALILGASFAGTAGLVGKVTAILGYKLALSPAAVGRVLDYLGAKYAVSIGA